MYTLNYGRIHRHSRNRGFVLVSALILLVTLTLIAVTVAYRNTMDEIMAANQRDYVNAMIIAESGIEEGFSLVKSTYVDDGIEEFKLTELGNYTPTSKSISGGSYQVTFPTVSATEIVMNSVGSVNGANREIEIIIEMLDVISGEWAILTDTEINALSGEMILTSADSGPSYPNIHSNANIIFTSNAQIEGIISSSGEVIVSGNPTVGGIVSGAAVVEIPHVYPPEYRKYATVILTADCRVTTQAGGLVVALGTDEKWNSWTCTPGITWTLVDSAPLAHEYYYIEGNIFLQASTSTVWYASFVAEGNIHIKSNSKFKPWAQDPNKQNDTGDSIANNILFLAGNDLVTDGNTDQEFFGILAAHMDIALNGNPFITGTITAENGRQFMGQEVTSGQTSNSLIDRNSFQGNITIVAQGTGLGISGKAPAVTAWREMLD